MNIERGLPTQSGQAKAVVIGVAALVVLTLAGIGFYAYKNPTFSLDGRDGRDPTRPLNNVGTTTTSTTGTSTIVVATSTPNQGSTSSSGTGQARPTSSRQTASAYSATQSAYGSYPFGITLPRGYTATQSTQKVYAGVPTTASYDFYSGGAYAFTVNVWSKEQWNDIRIQETINAKEGTGPDYLGEGRYIGENKTWIFSAVGNSYQPAGVGYAPAYYQGNVYSPSNIYIPPTVYGY